MIQLSQRLQDLLRDENADMYYLVEVKDYRLTNYHSDIPDPAGGAPFQSSDLVAGIQPPNATSSVDRSLYEIVLVDNRLELAVLPQSSLIGAIASVRIFFTDPITHSPELNELFTLYQGIVQGFDTSFDTSDEGQIISKVICSNVLAALDATGSFYTDRNSMRALNQYDSAFDQIFEGAGGVELRWGKR